MNKVIKYILSIILIAGSFMFISEIYTWYLYGFEDRYTYVTFYAEDGVASEEMTKDITEAAETHHVDIFVAERDIQSMLETNVDIYATDGAKAELKSSGIKPGVYRSILFGGFKIDIKDISEHPDLTKATDYKVTGEYSDIESFKQSLTDKYGGAPPRAGTPAFDAKLYISMTWCVVFFFLFLLTLYDVAVRKKEMVLLLVSGESIERHVVKNILTDVIFYIVLFTLAALGTAVLINGEFYISLSILMFLGFLLLNSAAYLWMLGISYRKDIASHYSLKKVLKASYLYKMFSMIIVILLLSGNMGLIVKGMEYKKQNDFFEFHQNYSYLMVALKAGESQKSFEEVNQIADELYQEYLSRGKAMTFVSVGYEPDNDNYIFADSGAADYLKRVIPEISSRGLDQKVYVIRPEDYIRTGNIGDSTETFIKGYTNCDPDEQEFETIEYETHALVTALDCNGGTSDERSFLASDPVIIFDNTGEIVKGDAIWHNGIVDLTETEWEEFLNENELQDGIVYKTSVMEEYQERWKTVRQGMIIGLTLFLLMILLELVIVNQVVSYEFKVNAKEFILLKISGTGFMDRYLKLFAFTIVSGFIGIATAVPAGFLMGFGVYKDIVISSLPVILAEIAVTVFSVVRMERINITKILKGGFQ